jgi:nucleotide-binding universal stress UspA family protein
LKPAFTRVVAATDFSPGAQLAARRAAAIASTHGCAAELVHVVSEPGLSSVRSWFRDRADVADRVVAEARGELDAAARTFGLAPRFLVGDVFEQLLGCASPETLLVLGAHGAGTLGDLLLGSTAERLVNESAGPVLVVRGDPLGPYREVLVGMDLEHGCAGLLAEVVALAPAARITAVHGYRVPFEGMLHRAGVAPAEVERFRADALKRAVEGIQASSAAATGDPARVLALADRGDPARLIVEHGRRVGADLLAVARRSRPRLHGLLIGSVARRVVAESDRDVLVLRGPSAD